MSYRCDLWFSLAFLGRLLLFKFCLFLLLNHTLKLLRVDDVLLHISLRLPVWSSLIHDFLVY